MQREVAEGGIIEARVYFSHAWLVFIIIMEKES
jgi:hypothetical protein